MNIDVSTNNGNSICLIYIKILVNISSIKMLLKVIKSSVLPSKTSFYLHIYIYIHIMIYIYQQKFCELKHLLINTLLKKFFWESDGKLLAI